MNFDLILSSLQDKGYRITKVRKEVVKIFSQTRKPLSANEIEEMLLKAGLSVNKATIYREIQFLLHSSLILKVYLYPDKISYESSELKHHHHLICDSCGSIDNVTNCLVEKLDEDVHKKKGFKIKRHMLEFYGTCADCAKNASRR